MSKDVVSIFIFNMIGNILYSFDKEEITSRTLILDLSRDGAGVYLIKATIDNGMEVPRFVQIY